jgi:molecular chaperone HtpG
MAENQDQIYYVLGDSLDSIAYSPHLDPFKDRGLEVLYLADPLDSFLTPVLTEFDGHKLVNIDDPELELAETDRPKPEPNEQLTVDDASFNRLVGRCVTKLGDRVTEVRQSKILRNSPVRLVSPESDPNRDMQRIRRIMDEKFETPPLILELNRGHSLITRLSQLVTQYPSDPVIDSSIEQLYENALILEGLHPNPITMLPRIQSLIELAVDRSLDNSDEEE